MLVPHRHALKANECSCINVIMLMQAIPLDPVDYLLRQHAAVPWQQPGSAVDHQLQLPEPSPFELCADFDTASGEILSSWLPEDEPAEPLHVPVHVLLDDPSLPTSAPPHYAQQTDGSVRLNMRLNISDIAQQASIIRRLVLRLVNTHDACVKFSITVSVQQHLLNITGQTGMGDTVRWSVDALPRPTILAAYLNCATPACMVLEGYHLQTANAWCFRDSEKPIEYLRHVENEISASHKSSISLVVPEHPASSPQQSMALQLQSAAADEGLQLHSAAAADESTAEQGGSIKMELPEALAGLASPSSSTEGTNACFTICLKMSSWRCSVLHPIQAQQQSVFHHLFSNVCAMSVSDVELCGMGPAMSSLNN